jgi:hypothetical protein
MLSDSDSEENDCHTLTINEHFAKAFQYKKEREELAKCEPTSPIYAVLHLLFTDDITAQ